MIFENLMSPISPGAVSPALLIFALRLIAAIGSSAIFGLVATSNQDGIALGPALLAGFVFGTVFVGGTGYRIILSVVRSKNVPSPASWSGAAAASAIGCLVTLPLWAGLGNDAARLLLAYALAINFAYLAVKASCMLAGCCHARVPFLGRFLGLRQVEIVVTLATLVAAVLVSFVSPWAGALIGVGLHTVLRLFSRHRRGRWSTGWPPLRQPGAELAPLQVLTLVAALGFLGVIA
jgi:hypothetical protein